MPLSLSCQIRAYKSKMWCNIIALIWGEIAVLELIFLEITRLDGGSYWVKLSQVWAIFTSTMEVISCDKVIHTQWQIFPIYLRDPSKEKNVTQTSVMGGCPRNRIPEDGVRSGIGGLKSRDVDGRYREQWLTGRKIRGAGIMVGNNNWG